MTGQHCIRQGDLNDVLFKQSVAGLFGIGTGAAADEHCPRGELDPKVRNATFATIGRTGCFGVALEAALGNLDCFLAGPGLVAILGEMSVTELFVSSIRTKIGSLPLSTLLASRSTQS